jgi:hypothetical protein
VKNFSVFQLALALSSIKRSSGSDRISNISRHDFQERKTFLCNTTSSSIEYACLMIENALVLRTNRGGRVYAGFGKLSGFQSVIDRYLRIADVSEAVYLFGRNDWQPPRHPNIRLITLDADFTLTQEIFLIAYSSTFNTAFMARRDETSPATKNSYAALKTSDDSVVMSLTNAVEGVINWSIAA